MLNFDLLMNIANNEFSYILSEVTVFKVLESKQVKYHETSFECGITWMLDFSKVNFSWGIT